MTDTRDAIKAYQDAVVPLAKADTTTEPSYYPAIRELLIDLLKGLGLPADVRTNTSEDRRGGGSDVPDVALYDREGDFVVVCGEVKPPRPGQDLSNLASSTEQNDQIGRYLAQTGVVILSNVWSFGLLTVDPEFAGDGPVPPEHRRLELTVEVWASPTRLKDGKDPLPSAGEELAELVETAVTRFAPIAEPSTLARVLATQARRAKAALPSRFTKAVQTLADDFGAALGITFEGEEGEEFFRSSLIQTVFYGLFAGWLLWAREAKKDEFDWRDLPSHLKIPFLGELFHEIQHPRRIKELGLSPYLDIASETLGRVRRDLFFQRLDLPELGGARDPERAAATAIVYFYEPFLETFDPELRKELGVWYTPPEIVQYQVRKVDRLLRDELNCPRGFADKRVVVLDPACGTGAYLIEALHVMAETLKEEGVDAELGATLLDAAITRVFGFEILTAPFVIAHLQLHLILTSLGSEPGEGQRPGVYLTNALTGWSPGEQLNLNFPELQEEHDGSQEVKQEKKIIVVLGNPPYNRFAGAPMAEELTLIDPYKGIKRRTDGKQLGVSDLYKQWGIRKHLLDDLYIRFFRLAEVRIGHEAEFGIVSYISNSSYLAGRSHPIMREELLRSFQEVWVDNLNGDKYTTGKIVPQGEPGEGDSDQSIFSTAQDPRGIQVGTAISTFLKRPQREGSTVVHYRDFWGDAEKKRTALLESLQMGQCKKPRLKEAAARPAGPRPYESLTPSEDRRWKIVPYEIAGGYEDWFSLEELFPVSYQGVNPNRGIQGSVIATDRSELEARMKAYFSDKSHEEFCREHPEICKDRARYSARATRDQLRKESMYDPDRVVPYLIFPLDCRWIYYETDQKLLNEARPELWRNLDSNEFLLAVPEPRQRSESFPLFSTTAFDLHVHDRGSVGFPARHVVHAPDKDLFTEGEPRDEEKANLNPDIWTRIKEEWSLTGDLSGEATKKLTKALFRVCLALTHAPDYQDEHQGALAQDWARVPVPRDRDLFVKVRDAGEQLATLLDPGLDARSVIRTILGGDESKLAVLSHTDDQAVQERDLALTISYFGSGRGRWEPRRFTPEETAHEAFGDTTGDLYLNDEVYFQNVPIRAWEYELGGYPVLKKWLGYRQADRRRGKPLSLREKDEFRSIVQRISAILVLHDRLDDLYEESSANAWAVLDQAEEMPRSV